MTSPLKKEIPSMVIPYTRLPADEVWKPIEDFPDYAVSESGLIWSHFFGRLVIRTLNNRGIVYASLTKDRNHYSKAVAPLVAETFLPLPALHIHRETFRTPIHLDGDRTNVHVRNLMWRPRWFAVDYHKQFGRDLQRYDYRVDDKDTGEHFDSVIDAAKCFGLRFRDIDHAIRMCTTAWPAGKTFRDCVHINM